MARPHPALIELAAGRPLPPVDDGGALVSSAIEHRTGGLLFSRALNDGFEAPDAWLRVLAQEDLRARAHQQRLWRALETVTWRLREEGFEVATGKGVTAQARWYDRMGERPCMDIDLLVDPDDVGRVEEVVRLLDPGHSLLPTVQSLVTSGSLQWVDIEVDRGIWVDLHLDLFKLGIAARRPDIIWGRTLPFRLPGGGEVRVPDGEMSLIHFLLHLNHDRFSYLLGFVDVCRILQREEDLDWGFIDRFLRGEGLETPVYLALDTVLDVLGLPGHRRHQVGGWRAAAWKSLWPATSTLQAGTGVRRERRRHFCLPLLARGRGRDALWWLARRAVPPRALVEHWYGDDARHYLWRLAAGRLRKLRPGRSLAVARPSVSQHATSRRTGADTHGAGGDHRA